MFFMKCSDSVLGPSFYYSSHQRAPLTPRFSQLSGRSVADPFEHLVRLILIPPPSLEVGLHSKVERELVTLPLSQKWDHFYQSTSDWWDREALSSKSAPFPSGPSLKFSCRIQDAFIISQV